MGEARAKMIARVQAVQLAHMHERDPMVIWSNLVMTHKVRGLAMELAKGRQLMTSKKGEAESITSWTSQVKELVSELKEVSTSVPEKIIIVVLTMGLGNEYDTLIGLIDTTLTQQVSLEHVITQMLNEEAWLMGRAMSYGDQALAAMKTMHNVHVCKCWRCGKKGHLQTQCALPNDT